MTFLEISVWRMFLSWVSPSALRVAGSLAVVPAAGRKTKRQLARGRAEVERRGLQRVGLEMQPRGRVGGQRRERRTPAVGVGVGCGLPAAAVGASTAAIATKTATRAMSRDDAQRDP